MMLVANCSQKVYQQRLESFSRGLVSHPVFNVQIWVFLDYLLNHVRRDHEDCAAVPGISDRTDDTPGYLSGNCARNTGIEIRPGLFGCILCRYV
jgi:hypothetical protein